VRPRRGSKARCSGCSRPAPGYGQRSQRRFEFIPIWGFAVVLLYAMRCVQCRYCGVKVERVPWALSKHTLCEAYMLFLAHWVRRSSWKETAQAFQTSWEKVFHAVEYVVQWGLQARSLDSVRAIGLDEIQPGRGHQYLTLVYDIGPDCQRLLWVGKERTTQSFKQFFALIGKELSEKIEFVSSDMWKPYLDLIKRHCTHALNILESVPYRGEERQSFLDQPRDEGDFLFCQLPGIWIRLRYGGHCPAGLPTAAWPQEHLLHFGAHFLRH
jgi:transposase